MFLTYAISLVYCSVHHRILISYGQDHIIVTREMKEVRLTSGLRGKFLRFFRVFSWGELSCPWPWVHLIRWPRFLLINSWWCNLNFLNSWWLLISPRRLSMILLRTTRHKLPTCPASRLWAAGFWSTSFSQRNSNDLRFKLWEQFLMLVVLKCHCQMLSFVRKSLLLMPAIVCTWFYAGSLC